MKNLIRTLFANEILSYLFFGGLTTLVYLLVRAGIFSLSQQSLLATAIANITAVLFAFTTNDTIVFRQKRQGWPARLAKFAASRLVTFLLDMVLTLIFVTAFPTIIGQFVGQDPVWIDRIESLFAQVTIIVLNYILSKAFVFKDKKGAS